MRAFLVLLRREWLEARTAFLWLPLGLFGFVVTVSLLAVLGSGFAELHIYIASDQSVFEGLFIGSWPDAVLASRMDSYRNLVTAPFYVLYLGAALFVLLGALYDERKDHSVLFWKSLPVSDAQTVLSKLTLAIWVAPLVMILIVLATQVYLLALLSVFLWTQELGNPARLWAHAGLIGGNLQLALGFLIQGLWVLPIAGWLLLVSATVSRLALLWAFLLPLIPAVAEPILFRTTYFSTSLSKHMEAAALPNFIGSARLSPAAETVPQQLSLLLSADLWAGVLVGCGLLYGAILMRQRRNEL